MDNRVKKLADRIKRQERAQRKRMITLYRDEDGAVYRGRPTDPAAQPLTQRDLEAIQAEYDHVFIVVYDR